MPDDKVKTFQEKLYAAAKSSPERKFYSLRDKVCRMDVLERSWKDVVSNGGAPGPDGVTIESIKDTGARTFLEDLHGELVSGAYMPGPVLRVDIPKPNGGKRPLGIPNVRDRVVQGAAKYAIEPIFEADFHPFSYGFRPGKSAKDASLEVQKWLNFGFEYVLDADIEKCFDEIPHDKLLMAVGRRISDGYIMKLVKMWLKAPVLIDGTLRSNKKGTPQGGVISPLLANIYLHQLDDEWVKRGMPEHSGFNAQLVRYADDLVVLSDKPLGHAVRTLREILTDLGLKLSERKTRVVFARDGFDFLGFRFVRRYSKKYGKKVTRFFPSPDSVMKVKRSIRDIAGNHRTHLPPLFVAMRLKVITTGWAAYFRHTHAGRAFSVVTGYQLLRFRIFLRRRTNKKGLGRYSDLPNKALFERYPLATWRDIAHGTG